MSRVVQVRSGDTRDAAGHRCDASPPLRETDVPVRRRSGTARRSGADLLVAEPGTVGTSAAGADRTGAGGDGAVPGGPRTVGGAGQRRPGDAGRPAQTAQLTETFAAADALYGALVGFLDGADAAGLTHEQLEARLDRDGRTLLRQLLQDHLDLRARREERRADVVDAQGRAHHAVEAGHCRGLETVFGRVTVARLAYRAKGAANLHLADAALNLPAERHSHGLRRLAAIEATRGSYEEAAAAIERQTGVRVGKRQVEALAANCAVDFEAFYQTRKRPFAEAGQTILMTVDGKGVVMRPEALRSPTAKAAARSKNKLKGRLSKGEKANRKRMAEVGAVYTVVPVSRTPDDVMAHRSGTSTPQSAPTAADKWVTASVVDDAAAVIADVFDQAALRDPGQARDWVALVDGNRHQIDRITTEAKTRDVTVTIVCDWVHVLEYIWSAAWSFFTEGDPAAEDWVQHKALEVLRGKASIVAAAIRRKATTLRLTPADRKNADTCANYLLAKAPYLDYPTALAKGWPIATGVIEGACRHLVKDRMDITGARWGLPGAETILKLRAIRTNGDWDAYWAFHLTQERRRVHDSRYLTDQIPAAA